MDISSVSFYEYAQLVGQYNRLVHKPQIDTQLLTRGYSEEALKQMQSKMSGGVKELISLDLHFKSGLDKFMHPLFNFFMSIHEMYSKGAMPYPGSISDQPSKIIEIFHILDQLKTERDIKHHEEQERLAKRNQKRKRK
jgi:hypothetical protein